MGIWVNIIAHTSTSPLKLLAFGGVCIAASYGIGSLFDRLMHPPSVVEPVSQAKRQQMSYEDRRMVSGREQRLSAMIKDVLEGKGDDHWHAAMRGTVMKHPGHESKTEGMQREALARAAEAAAAAEASSKRKGWWG